MLPTVPLPVLRKCIIAPPCVLDPTFGTSLPSPTDVTAPSSQKERRERFPEQEEALEMDVSVAVGYLVVASLALVGLFFLIKFMQVGTRQG